ncbi:unnamed protein product [Diabrotica balteata]|uniref:F-box domain-containing protein n=1 Tax=Diabrotica balteata TaxID=107213 RepID=A0A9P0E0T5_DIABA|nr:unnamed protein product [Diabrotica balteata]
MSSTTVVSLRGSNVSFKVRSGFGQLPEKILLNIFQYFNEDELRKNIIPVCQQWRTVAENPRLWKILKFTGMSTNTSVICFKIWQLNKAEEIHMKGIKQPLVVLRQICRCAQNIVSISLRHCHEISEDGLRHLIVSCKSLKILDLKGTPFKSLIFYEELACTKNLSNINISENIYVTVSHISSLVVNCPSLDGLHISSFQPINRIFITDGDAYFFLSHISKRLRSLSLDCSNLSTGSFSSILGCKNLEYLCLNFAYNFDGNIFQNLWKTLRKLKALKIRYGHQISDANIKNLFQNGRDSLSNIEVIDLTGCSKLSNFGIAALAICCKKLKKLILRSCKNVFTIDYILEECHDLEMLNISFCKNLQCKYQSNSISLKIMFLSDDKKVIEVGNFLKSKNNNLQLKLCESEHNKNYRKL